MTSSMFEESYKKFLYLWEEACFPINYYSITILKSEEHYPEIAIVNILQCLDGIYDILEITKINRKYLTGSEAKKVRNEVNNIQLENIDDNKKEILEQQLKEAICRIEYCNYENKLRNIFNFIDKYNIFKLEKKQKEENKTLINL